MKSLFRVSVLVLVVFGFAVASSPQDALLYQGANLVRAREDVQRANDKLGILSYLDAGIALKPSAVYSDKLNDEVGGTFTPRISSELSLSYRYSNTTIIQNQRGVLTAQLNLIKAERDGVVEALTAHVELLRAQLAAQAAEQTFAEAEANVEVVTTAFEAGTQTRNQLNQANIGLERATLANDQAQGRLEDALTKAADYGLSAPATFEFFRFVLPSVTLSELLAAQDRQLLIEENRAKLDQLYFLSTVSEVDVSLGYSAQGIGAEASAGIFESVPGANLEFTSPGTTDPTFRFGLSAEIGFEADRITEIADAERNLERAEEDYDTFLETLETDLINAYEAALFAEEDMALALEAYDLDARIVADAEQLVADLTAAQEGAEDPEKAKKDLETATSNLAKARAALGRSEDAIYQKWLAYVQRVRDYLVRAEANFVVRESE